MSGTSELVKAVEDAWAAIRARHPDVPEVLVAVGAGSEGGKGAGLRLGHFAPLRWVRGEDEVHELFVGGEGLTRGAVPVLGTLLHEAAHGIAATRGIQDTSRQGRYHNRKFQALAAEVGIDVEHSDSLGFSTTTVPSATAAAYASTVEQLHRAITAFRRTETSLAGTGRTSSNNGVVLVCGCGRKVRASNTVAEAGPITCGLCGEDFQPEA